jgi:hypothetical protein
MNSYIDMSSRFRHYLGAAFIRLFSRRRRSSGRLMNLSLMSHVIDRTAGPASLRHELQRLHFEHNYCRMALYGAARANLRLLALLATAKTLQKMPRLCALRHSRRALISFADSIFMT